jgi:hypothetical protein
VPKNDRNILLFIYLSAAYIPGLENKNSNEKTTTSYSALKPYGAMPPK